MAEKFEKFKFRESIQSIDKINFLDIDKSKTNIIFDTNFLFVTFEFKVDVIEEIKKLIGSDYYLYIYEGTILELENIERKKDKNRHFLPLISKMLKLYNFKIIKSKKEYIDDQILENLDENIIIATNDKELRQTIFSRRFKVLYLRQKAYLEIK